MFEPRPRTFIFLNPFIFFKNNDKSFKVLGLKITLAEPPRLNQEYLERLESNSILPKKEFFCFFICEIKFI